ncbi:unnamed protein product [Spodoptera exigua]|nr:unnamed protein product [Spodoptera exigua]
MGRLDRSDTTASQKTGVQQPQRCVLPYPVQQFVDHTKSVPCENRISDTLRGSQSPTNAPTVQSDNQIEIFVCSYTKVTKAHDPTLFEAVHRLSGVLGRYMVIYNQLIECCHQNLQVQKTVFIDNIIKALVSRILELRAGLEKLEGSRFQFIGHGLTEVHHTIFDIDMTAIPLEEGRPKHIQKEFDKILAKVKEIKEYVEEEEVEEEEIEGPKYTFEELWGIKLEDDEPVFKAKEVDLSIPEELRKTREYLALILAHEKTRQVMKMMKKRQLRRETWVKELTGTLQPPARYEIRERSSKLISKVFRAYFELKRRRIKDCKRDQLLGINICESQKFYIQRNNADKMLHDRSKLRGIYEKEWIKQRNKIKENILKYKQAKICDELRDQIREWFLQWFDAVQFFYNIPKEGSIAIFKGDVPSPQDWYEENETRLQKIAADKKKNTQDIFEKINFHAQVIDYYHQSWDIYDMWETKEVKEKFVHEVDVSNAIIEVSLEVMPKVDEDMRKELTQLKKALIEDYKTLEREMPIDVTKPIIKRDKKKKIARIKLNSKVKKMIEDLALQDVIVDYPRVKLEDFIGDPNFAGEDLRRQIVPTFPFNFEIRAYWWERCREVNHRFHRILLVGPKGSGKDILVKVLASINGSCANPWSAKSKAMLKSFPTVLLLPNNTYSTVVQILKDWVVKYEVLPSNFNVTNLAYVLQGYSFGYVKEALERFMSADRIIKIAAYGITPMEVYDYILNDENAAKVIIKMNHKRRYSASNQYRGLEEALNNILEDSDDGLEYDLAIIPPEPSVVTDKEEGFDDETIANNLPGDVPGEIEVFVQNIGTLSDSEDDSDNEPLAAKRTRKNNTQRSNESSDAQNRSALNVPTWHNDDVNILRKALLVSRRADAATSRTPLMRKNPSVVRN